MCSETSEAVGTTWEHAQLEFQKFLKIRIPLVVNRSLEVGIGIPFSAYIVQRSEPGFPSLRCQKRKGRVKLEVHVLRSPFHILVSSFS